MIKICMKISWKLLEKRAVLFIPHRWKQKNSFGSLNEVYLWSQVENDHGQSKYCTIIKQKIKWLYMDNKNISISTATLACMTMVWNFKKKLWRVELMRVHPQSTPSSIRGPLSVESKLSLSEPKKVLANQLHSKSFKASTRHPPFKTEMS